jgi:hypothetical protein
VWGGRAPTGQHGQVDWGHLGTIWHAGRPRRLYGVALTLGYARALDAAFTVSSGMMAFLRCHMHAFADLGGVPEHLLHDHQKPVGPTHDPGGAHLGNARDLDFADHDGFVPRLCRPDRAQPTGQVASGSQYLRRNFWPSCPDVPALDALHEALGGWRAEVANVRMHGTTPAVPLVRLAQEPLRPVNVAPYELAMVSTRWSSKDGLIGYGGNRSSVPAGDAFSQLTVCETPEGRLDIYAGRECIARHDLVAGPHQSLVDPAHVDALWPALKAHESPHPMPLAGPRVGPPVTEPPVEVRSLEFYEAVVMGEA